MEPVGLDAIIYDFDGTLSATLPRQEAWFKKWAKMNDKPWPFKDFNEFVVVYNDTLSSTDDVMGNVQKFYDSLDLPCDMKDMPREGHEGHPVWQEYNKYKDENPEGLYEGVKEMLDEIYKLGSLSKNPNIPKRLRMAINTTNSWESIADELTKAGVLHYFDTQTAAEMLDQYHGAGNGNAIKKPSKLSVALTLDNLGTEGARTMHVGDTLSDLRASRQVVRPGYGPSHPEDLIMVGVSWGYEGKDTLQEGVLLPNGERTHFDYIIEQPQDLIWLVKKHRKID